MVIIMYNLMGYIMGNGDMIEGIYYDPFGQNRGAGWVKIIDLSLFWGEFQTPLFSSINQRVGRTSMVISNLIGARNLAFPSFIIINHY